MKELRIEEIKKIQLNILLKTTEFCDKNNINYFLCAGTLLGAVRHKGFIPWDDDIDIMMPRPDYERFVRNYKSDDLIVLDSRMVKGYYYPFCKVSDKNTVLHEDDNSTIELGINIDVFPLDGIPDDNEIIKSQIKRVNLRRLILSWKIAKVNKEWQWHKRMVYPLLKFIAKRMPTSYVVNDIIRIAKKHDFNYNSKAGIIVWGYREREICPKEVFTSSIQLTFEGIEFNAPKDYDIYLTSVYGNYMKFPPKNQQVRKHDFKAYLKA